MFRIVKYLLVVAWSAASLWFLIQTAHVAQRSYDRFASGHTSPPFSALHPHLVNILSMGHKGIYDDFLHIWLMQIVFHEAGEEAADPENVSRILADILKHKPSIESLYMLACFYFSSDSVKQPEKCEDIIITGMQVFPESWRLPMTQGFIFAFKLEQPARAAAFYKLASSRTTSPPYVARVAKKLISKEPLSEADKESTLKMISKVPGGRSKFQELLREEKLSNDGA